MRRKGFSIGRIVQSLRHARSGLLDMLRTEPNAWIHGVATLLVLAVAWWVQLDVVRFGLLVVAIVSVWVAEAFNTVIEIVVDFVSPEYSAVARRAKDIAAAAVLVTVVGAVILGAVILGPALFEHFTSNT